MNIWLKYVWRRQVFRIIVRDFLGEESKEENFSFIYVFLCCLFFGPGSWTRTFTMNYNLTPHFLFWDMVLLSCPDWSCDPPALSSWSAGVTRVCDNSWFPFMYFNELKFSIITWKTEKHEFLRCENLRVDRSHFSFWNFYSKHMFLY